MVMDWRGRTHDDIVDSLLTIKRIFVSRTAGLNISGGKECCETVLDDSEGHDTFRLC